MRYGIHLYREKQAKKFAITRAEQLELNALTPYGEWAIPESIVMCESGGDFGAYNPGYEPDGPGTGPGGAYQIILSTWRGYGGSGKPRYASEIEQHSVAGRIWNGGAGRSQWAC